MQVVAGGSVPILLQGMMIILSQKIVSQHKSLVTHKKSNEVKEKEEGRLFCCYWLDNKKKIRKFQICCFKRHFLDNYHHVIFFLFHGKTCHHITQNLS